MKKKLFSAFLVVFLIFSLSFSLSGCSTENSTPVSREDSAQSGRTVTDMLGRKVVVSEKISKVYTSSPIETIILYTIDPSLMAGWSYYMVSKENSFILPQYKDLPVLGAWSANNKTASVEEILKAKPDLILMSSQRTLDTKKFADEVEELTKIPVFVLDTSITAMPEAYLYAGKALGREARTAELAAYCRETVNMIQDKKHLLKGKKPISVYYAEGPNGLETEPRGSWHTEILDFVGAVNAADPNLPKGSAIGRTPVSLEQVMLWNPEVIIVTYFINSEQSSFPKIMGQSGWNDIRAVQEGKVYEIPYYPFNWFDRPPGVNRFIGIRWLANLLYPDIYPLNLRDEAKRFYSLFYHYQLSEQETDELLHRAMRKQD